MHAGASKMHDLSHTYRILVITVMFCMDDIHGLAAGFTSLHCLLGAYVDPAGGGVNVATTNVGHSYNCNS